MKRSLWLIVPALALVLLSGCERIFTTSPFAFLRRDPSSYSVAQQIAFAEDALASGDEEAMAVAFELLRDSTDPETQLLAVELGLGAAGVEAAISSVLAGLATEGADPETVIGEALASFSDEDLEILVETAALLDTADESIAPTAEQYAFTAVGLIAAAAASEGVENLSNPTPDSDAEGYVNQAGEFLEAAEAILVTEGGSTDILSGFSGIIA